MAFEQPASLESLETKLANEVARSDKYVSIIDGASTSNDYNSRRAMIIIASEMRIKRIEKQIEREKKRIKHEQKRIAHEQTTTPEGQSND